MTDCRLSKNEMINLLSEVGNTYKLICQTSPPGGLNNMKPK